MSPALRRILMRSFLIQGGWNYRTLLGAGFAWALLPATRGGRTPAEEELWVEEHSGYFNLHPYLAPAALAAVARMEEEGRPDEEVRRFKSAIGSLFGSVGDGLFWNAWRPVALASAIGAAALGMGAVAVVTGFLVLYNLLHLRVRFQGVRLGWDAGVKVGEGIREMKIPEWTERIRTVGVLILGLISGLLLGMGTGADLTAWVLPALSLVALSLGWFLGETVHRWIPAVFLALIISGYLPIWS